MAVDPQTFRMVSHFKVRRQPQHVTPSYDLKTLRVLSDLGDRLTKIDPATGKKGETIRVKHPYNMYYTPGGKFAILAWSIPSRSRAGAPAIWFFRGWEISDR